LIWLFSSPIFPDHINHFNYFINQIHFVNLHVGDFEGDLIIGKAHKGAVISLVNRKSLYPLLRLTPSKEAPRVSQKISRALQPFNNGRFHTLTLDDGLEFADHKNISEKLVKMVYFTDP
jgi:IS30 family transposase